MSHSMKNKLINMGKTALGFRCIPLLPLATLMVCSLPAYAEYSFQVIDPPGSLYTQAFGINDAGKVTGVADDGVDVFSFMYDMKRGEYTDLGSEMSIVEISNPGVMVGRIGGGLLEGECAIRDKKGWVSTFYPPIASAGGQCQARGVNSKGMVSGFEIDATGVWTGFVYDPKKGTYEEFLSSPSTIAHAINARGTIAGHVYLDADVAYPGSLAGRYGFLREKNGSVKYFAISDSFPGQTRARGISDSGLVAGYYVDSVTIEAMSYVTTLSKGTEFETVTLTDDQVIHRSPCNPDVPASPGPDFILMTDMFASQVRNDGVVVGSCVDYYWNGDPNATVTYGYGFIATPIKQKKKK